jgi:hypothetical protein
MRALVVYESMYGNTREIAAAVAEGLRRSYEVDVVAAGRATRALVDGADLLVAGGPTHAHGLSRPWTRKAAAQASSRPGGPALDPDAGGLSLRSWLEDLATAHGGASAAAFDTRLSGPSAFTGQASAAISRRLRRLGYRRVAPPASFLVDKQNHLLPGELQRAAQWGSSLAASGRTASGGSAERPGAARPK